MVKKEKILSRQEMIEVLRGYSNYLALNLPENSRRRVVDFDGKKYVVICQQDFLRLRKENWPIPKGKVLPTENHVEIVFGSLSEAQFVCFGVRNRTKQPLTKKRIVKAYWDAMVWKAQQKFPGKNRTELVRAIKIGVVRSITIPEYGRYVDYCASLGMEVPPTSSLENFLHKNKIPMSRFVLEVLGQRHMKVSLDKPDELSREYILWCFIARYNLLGRVPTVGEMSKSYLDIEGKTPNIPPISRQEVAEFFPGKTRELHAAFEAETGIKVRIEFQNLTRFANELLAIHGGDVGCVRREEVTQELWDYIHDRQKFIAQVFLEKYRAEGSVAKVFGSKACDETKPISRELIRNYFEAQNIFYNYVRQNFGIDLNPSKSKVPIESANAVGRGGL